MMNLSYSFPLKKYLGRVIIFAFKFCLKEAMLVRLRVSYQLIHLYQKGRLHGFTS